MAPNHELALRRALVGEVPPFVHTITAVSADGQIRPEVYHLPTVKKGWKQKFEEVIESEFDQCLPARPVPPLQFTFREQAVFEASEPTCLLHRRP
jgi:hypothetical protein